MRHEPPKEITDYIEGQYYLAWSDFECACIKKDREKQWEARREIARLERMAVEMCGIGYTRYLQRCYGHYDSDK